MENKIKAIVFDYGGVIEISNGISPLRVASQSIGIPVNEIENIYFKYNHLSNAKNMNWYDMFDLVLAELKVTDEIKETTINLIKENQKSGVLNEDLISVLPKLSQNGFILSIFSNYTSVLRTKLKDQKIDHLFDNIVISEEIGLQKPDVNAFAKLFEVLGVSPEEVVFIDDTPKSLETAPLIGYKPILFKNTDQLLLDLGDLGIKV